MITGKALNRSISYYFLSTFQGVISKKMLRDFAILYLSSSCV